MSSLILKSILAAVAVGVTATGMANAEPGVAGSATNSVETVQQELKGFSNRYGTPVIIHGALNLNAPVSMAYSSSLSSDQAIGILSDAAGAQAKRVYFVTPTDSQLVTTQSVARELVPANSGDVNLNLQHVSAVDAIRAVAATDGAEVRFPDGMPTGTVTMRGYALSLSRAVAMAATLTKTHWSLGYILESTNPNLPSLSPTDQAKNLSPGTSGDSASNTVMASSSAVPGWPVAKVTDDLPPLKPLARDAKGNILPITVHFQVVQPEKPAVPLTASQTAEAQNQAAAAAQNQQYYGNQYNYNNYNNSANWAQSDYLNSFPAFSVSATPNEGTQGGNSSTFSVTTPPTGFNLLPDWGYPYGY